MNFINGEPTTQPGLNFRGFFNLSEVIGGKRRKEPKTQTFTVDRCGRGFIVCRVVFNSKGLPERHEIMGFLKEQDADNYASKLVYRLK